MHNLSLRYIALGLLLMHLGHKYSQTSKTQSPRRSFSWLEVYANKNKSRTGRNEIGTDFSDVTYPNPIKAPKRCGRVEASHVCDPDNVLTEKEASSLDGWLHELCLDSDCHCRTCPEKCPGVQVSVLLLQRFPTLPQLDRHNSSNAGRQAAFAEEWLTRLRRDIWTFGSCDDDIVVLVTMLDDHRLHTSVGASTREVIPSLCMDQVHSWINQHLDHGGIAQALRLLLQDFRDIFSGVHHCQTFPNFVSTGKKIGMVYGAISIPLMVCVVLVFLGPCFRGRGFGGSQHKMIFQSYNRRRQDVREGRHQLYDRDTL